LYIIGISILEGIVNVQLFKVSLINGCNSQNNMQNG